MRVLLLNQYYRPDVAATAQLCGDLGEALARRGHEVIAIAGDRSYSRASSRSHSGSPDRAHVQAHSRSKARAYAGSEAQAHAAAGGDPLGDRLDQRLPRHQVRAGVEINRVRCTALGRRHRLLRAIDYGSFFAGAAAPILLGERPEVLLALTTPPLIAGLGALAKVLRGVRLVVWMMDVYPELAFHLGAVARASLFARALGRVSRALLDRADAVVVLDEAMRERLVAEGLRPSKIEVIDNWCVGEAVRPAPLAENPLRRALGLGDTFTVSYSGHMGRGHDFATLRDALPLLRGERVHFLFIGDGPHREALAAAARANAVPATFLDYRPADELPVSLTAAHASMVSLEAGTSGLMVPSKLYGLLAAGVPIVYVGPSSGRVHDVVANERLGCSIRNGDALGLAGAILSLRDDEGARAAMGTRARELHERRFTRELAFERHHQLLLRVAGVTRVTQAAGSPC